MKKFLILAIISMLVFTGFGTFSTATSNNGKPDFVINVLNYNPIDGSSSVLVEVGISNIGAALTNVVSVEVKLTLDSNEETLRFPYLGTGPSDTKEILIEYDEDEESHLLTAEVDKDNAIPEEREDNNIKTIDVKSKNKLKMKNFIELIVMNFLLKFHIIRAFI